MPHAPSSLQRLLPDRSQLLRMEPHELAGYVLQDLVASEKSNRSLLHLRNYGLEQARAYGDFNSSARDVGQHCADAFAWLLHSGFLSHNFEQEFGWVAITSLGRRIADHTSLAAHLAERELPATFLHPEVATASRDLFLRGEFDTAVFKAYRAVEVAIRAAARLGDDLVGVKLARRAFGPGDGPLADLDAESGERESLMNLVAGALGSFKNPASHRHVTLNAPEARDMLAFASLLMRIDARSAARHT